MGFADLLEQNYERISHRHSPLYSTSMECIMHDSLIKCNTTIVSATRSTIRHQFYLCPWRLSCVLAPPSCNVGQRLNYRYLGTSPWSYRRCARRSIDRTDLYAYRFVLPSAICGQVPWS